MENVNDNYESKPYKKAHIKDTNNSNRNDTLHTKPTTQLTKTLGVEPTVAAGRKPATRPTHADSTTPLLPIKEIQKQHINNDYDTLKLEHTITKETQQTNTQSQLTMSTPEQPSTPGPNRRRAQRFKRGGHETQLGS